MVMRFDTIPSPATFVQGRARSLYLLCLVDDFVSTRSRCSEATLIHDCVMLRSHGGLSTEIDVLERIRIESAGFAA